MTLKIKMDVDVPENMLGDLMITAFDGDYGGCWYWSEPDLADEKDEYLKQAEDGTWLEVSIRSSLADEGDWKFWNVNHSTLVAGMQKILDEDFSGHEAMRRMQSRIREAIIEDDAGELDANDADTIVQYALFDNEVYS